MRLIANLAALNDALEVAKANVVDAAMNVQSHVQKRAIFTVVLVAKVLVGQDVIEDVEDRVVACVQLAVLVVLI